MKRPRLAGADIAGFAAFALIVAAGGLAPTPYDNDVVLASAWLHGHAWIVFPGNAIDAVPYHGKAYIVEGPLPAILLLPLVAAQGTAANQAVLSCALGGLAVCAAWRLCERIGLPATTTLAAVSFLFFGTSLFACSARAGVWPLAHVAAVCFTLLALAELFGSERAWLVALWGVAAALSRFPLVAALPLYLVWLLRYGGSAAGTLLRFAAPLVPAVAFMAWYDLARWGTLLDRGYAIWYRVMDARYPENPQLFSLAYLPRQLAFMFGLAPQAVERPPWIVSGAFGLSLQYTSLPFCYALFAGWNIRVALLWLATLATLLPSLLYFDVGPWYGVRHALDFEPFLFALTALALRRRPLAFVVAALSVEAIFGAVESFYWLAHAPL